MSRPKKDPAAPKAKYVRKDPRTPAQQAVARIAEDPELLPLVESWRAEPVSNAPGLILTELEEAVLVEYRRGRSARWIETHLGYSSRKVRQLVHTDRGQSFLQTLSREFAALKASRLAEAAFNATNYLDELLAKAPEFMADEGFAELPLKDRIDKVLAWENMRVKAAGELLRTDTKAGPSVSVQVSTQASPVVTELLRALRGDVVDVDQCEERPRRPTHETGR